MNVIIAPSFQEAFYKLTKSVQEQIKKRLKLIETNPEHFIEGLKDDERLKIRAGDYRIFSLKKEENLYLTFVEHRKKAYKKHVF